MYERRGLISPERTSGNTRRYSERDLERIRMIQELTQGGGVSLAGVKLFMEMRQQLVELQRREHELERELLLRIAARERTSIVPLRSVQRFSWQERGGS
jgi:MerR family transcriptional regulator/heat shock protein HspR